MTRGPLTLAIALGTAVTLWGIDQRLLHRTGTSPAATGPQDLRPGAAAR